MTTTTTTTAYDEEVQPDEYVEIDGFTTFENAGDAVTGALLGNVIPEVETEPGEKPKRAVRQWLILTPEGITRFNTTSQLDSLLNIPTGTQVRVVFQGETKTAAGYKVKVFSIGVLKSQMQRVQRIMMAHLQADDEMALPAGF